MYFECIPKLEDKWIYTETNKAIPLAYLLVPIEKYLLKIRRNIYDNQYKYLK